jgi:TolA-binding protein
MWYGRFSVLVLAAWFAADALALEVRRYTVPPAMTELFRELERELRELRQGGEAASRRIAELEVEVRDAQARIARLESEQTLLKMRIGALETALAKPPAEAPATPGKGTTPSPPSPKPSTPEAPAKAPESPGATIAAAVKITTDKRSVEGGYVAVAGTVKNTLSEPVAFLIVEATFLAADGSVVKTAAGYTNPRVIRPGGTASFKIATGFDERIKSHKLAIRTE